MTPVTPRLLAAAAAVLGAMAIPAAAAPIPGPRPVDPSVPAKRDTEPVILKGRVFAGWAAPSNVTAKLPLMDLAGSGACSTRYDLAKLGGVDPATLTPQELVKKLQGLADNGVGIPDPGPATNGAITYDPDACPPQDYATPEADTGTAAGAGAPTDRLLGYAWRGGRFRQIPLQVDELFTRYLDNSRSGFSIYSGQDQHTTYAYDREGFRWTDNEPDDPCQAKPRSPVASDPVPGLDTNDEVVFMAADAGRQAPAGARLPRGIADARRVAITDPARPGATRYAYVMRAKADGPRPAYDASNGYVRYQRDANADRFAFSQSSYASYGNTLKGPYCDPVTGLRDTSHGEIAQRRPLDGATVTTKRYRYRYDGRWLMTGIEISPDNGRSYGPDLVDRWKARAFAQDPGSNTPCCGYEEEDSNWGGSSITLGERAGPVRAIRETWGADSGTNVIRRETFYRSEMRMKTFLRVHVIPPLDGIYAQWDFNAGRMTRFYNPATAEKGVPVDGRNDEIFGNLDDPCRSRWDGNDSGTLTQTYRQAYRMLAFGGYSWCEAFPYHQSVDLVDPTFSDANAALTWSVTAGPHGTIVDRYGQEPEDVTPGGAPQSVVAVPYYRDDACFDDGTGSDPGPELHPRNFDAEQASTAPDGSPRRCWDGTGVPGGDPRLWQGSIATHGLHLLFLVDSDNARQTVPVNELVTENRMVMLPGQRDGRTGEQYGRGFEKPLVPIVTPGVGGRPAGEPSRGGEDERGRRPAKRGGQRGRGDSGRRSPR